MRSGCARSWPNLVNRAAAVVKRYGGTVASSPATASWRCSARQSRWRITLFAPAWRRWAYRRDRSGLPPTSTIAMVWISPAARGPELGQVIAGDVGSTSLGYTAIGEQVGMAQRMESVAPSGGVMLWASTARLVDDVAVLGEPETGPIKGADEPVRAQRLLGMEERHHLSSASSRIWSGGGGRCTPSKACWTVRSRATAVSSVWWGHLASARAVWCAKCLRWRATRGVEVFTAFCESHTSQVPFHAVARLLRVAFGVDDLDGREARDRVRDRVPDADPEDLALFDDLLGIADPETPYPKSIPMLVGGG